MDDEELRAGLTLGRYELLVPIADGGTASVWAARMKGPRGFEKIVAAKVMLSELLDDPDAETMFLDEARTVARIRHPNVAEVLDLGEEQGILFLVMEWVDGEPLTVITREARAIGGVPLRSRSRSPSKPAPGSTPRTSSSTTRGAMSASSIAMSRRRTCSSATTGR